MKEKLLITTKDTSKSFIIKSAQRRQASRTEQRQHANHIKILRQMGLAPFTSKNLVL